MRPTISNRVGVWLVGDVEHADFADALAMVRATADTSARLPELIVLVESRPGTIAARDIDRLRRSSPLAGMVALVGSWCEGETRTGKPAPGLARVYWYDFPAWWQRQLALRTVGKCPDWAQGDDFGLRTVECETSSHALRNPLIVLDTFRWDTADALNDALRGGGFATVWLRTDDDLRDRAVASGIWEGGQLDDAEEERLEAFCSSLARHQAPVIALLDFPRHDRCDAARRAGAVDVLGKPWRNADLVAALRNVIEERSVLRAA